MAKNPYSKSVKLFSKSESLFIQRKDETVFISEGHIILKIHIAAYDAFFRPSSGQFIEMNDGDNAGRQGNMIIPEKHSTFDIEKCYEGFKCEAVESVSVSPFLMEYSKDGKKKLYQRMLCGRGYYVSISNDFYELAEESGFTSFANKGTSVSAVFAESGDYNGIAILPIRADQQKIESFVNVCR